MDAAPSWISTSLRYLQTKHPSFFNAGRGAATVDGQLHRALMKMKFRWVELVHCSDEPTKTAEQAWQQTLFRQVQVWDEECHRQMREFLDEGGHSAEMTKAKAVPKKAPLDSPTDVSDKELEKVVRDLRPPSSHSPEQELEEAVQLEQLQRDPRLGAW